MKAMLISIKPKYAKKIIFGCKTVELRRIAPKVHSPMIIFIYESNPVKAITGYAVLDSVTSSNPSKLWEMFACETQVSKSEFDIYYEGTEKAHALHISQATSFTKPIKLEELRSQKFLTQPPQSYKYVFIKDLPKSISIEISLPQLIKYECLHNN
jgi:predicted transcriptional regulator